MATRVCSASSYTLRTVGMSGFGLLTLCSFGLFGNVICLAVLIQSYLGTAAFSHYLTALCAADTITLVSCLFMLVIPILTSFYAAHDDVLAVVNHLMVTFYPVGTAAENASTLLVTVISVVRYLAVSYPIKMKVFSSPNSARCIIAVVFTFACFFNLPRLFELSLTPCVSQNNQTLMTLGVTSLRSSYSYKVFYLILSNGLIMFLVPFCLVLYCNCAVAYRHWSDGQTFKFGSSRRHVSAARQETAMTTRLLVFISVFFLVSQFMPLVLNMLEGSFFVFNVMIVNDKTFALLVDISNFLVVLKASSNFFFYMLFNIRFRQVVLNPRNRFHFRRH